METDPISKKVCFAETQFQWIMPKMSHFCSNMQSAKHLEGTLICKCNILYGSEVIEHISKWDMLCLVFQFTNGIIVYRIYTVHRISVRAEIQIRK
jgi:hypothetical protein